MNEATNLVLYFTFFVSLYFEVFILINFLENKQSIRDEERKTPTLFPSVTIIIPVYNEENTLTKTVFSLLKLDYPKEKLKIIIVNDGSTDNTPNVLKRFKNNTRIEIINKKNGGKYTALNVGIAKVKTDLVGCLDADSFVMPDTLKKIICHFEDARTMAVTPAIKIATPDRFIRHVQQNEYNLGIFMKKTFSILDSITVTPGPFSIFRKSVFDNLGLFREAYNTEDLEIAMRMQKNSYKIRNAHNALVYTVGPDTIKKLYKQRVRWVHGFLANTIDYRTMLLNRKYGNLGTFMLPMAVVSVFLFFMSICIAVLNLIHEINLKILELQSIGLTWQWRGFHFDWFFVNTDTKMFLGAILFFSTIFLILYGKQISERKIGKISFHTLIFPFVYPLLSLLWLSKALYTTALSKEVTWR